jgi:hypothetical protein
MSRFPDDSLSFMVRVCGRFHEKFDREREPPVIIPARRLVHPFCRILVILNYSKEVARLLAVLLRVFVPAR